MNTINPRHIIMIFSSVDIHLAALAGAALAFFLVDGVQRQLAGLFAAHARRNVHIEVVLWLTVVGVVQPAVGRNGFVKTHWVCNVIIFRDFFGLLRHLIF